MRLKIWLWFLQYSGRGRDADNMVLINSLDLFVLLKGGVIQDSE